MRKNWRTVAIQEVKIIICPGFGHDTYVEDWRIAFPMAQVLAPAALFGMVSDVNRHIGHVIHVS